MSKEGGKRPLPTPSPLRRMEDPSLDHIMPSRKGRSRASAMPPPPPRPKTKEPGALDEDTFVEALGEIIERDFFPDLPKLQRQLKWLEGLESRNVPSVTEVRRVVMSEQRRFGQQQTPLAGVAAGGATPLPGSTPLVGGGGGASSAGSRQQEEAEKPGLVPPNLSLDQFLAQYRSEDDASFEELAVKMREAHRRKYWWVYEHPAIESGKEALYLLTSGEVMTEEQRKARDEAVNSKPRRGDERPNAPDSWTYRVKNALLFQPELEQTVKVHKVGGDGLMLLEDGKVAVAGAGGALVVSSNPRVGEAAKAPKVVVHKNTRFVPGDGMGPPGGLLLTSPIERLRTDLSTLSSDTTASAEAQATNQGFVPMTPAIIPGAGGQSPFVTWGEIEGTPLRVAEPFDRSSSDGPTRGFKLKDPSYREKLASSLESSARKKGGSATPKIYSSSRGGPSSRTPGSVGMRSTGGLTPAAQSLAQKLAEQKAGGRGAGDVFGEGLRASYRGGGSSTGPGAGAKRGATPSPMVRPASSKRAKQGGASSSGGGSSNRGTSLTDNLLDI